MTHALWSDSPKLSSALLVLAERSRNAARLTPFPDEDFTVRHQRQNFPIMDAGMAKILRVAVKTRREN